MKIILQNFIPALKFVSECAAKDDIRYYLNGVLFESLDSNNFRLVSTDGHALARIDVACEEPHGIAKGQYLIPLEKVKQIISTFKFTKKMLNMPIKLTFTDNGACVESLGDTITFLCINGKYPDYERLTPKDSKNAFFESGIVGMNSKLVLTAMKACNHIANSYGSVRMVSRGENTAVTFEPVLSHQESLSNALVIVMPLRL
jgi:DNA polymerase III sliding clamp (beta) subunit (PCNA family)